MGFFISFPGKKLEETNPVDDYNNCYSNDSNCDLNFYPNGKELKYSIL